MGIEKLKNKKKDVESVGIGVNDASKMSFTPKTINTIFVNGYI